jgi:hypothetical protein
MIDLMAAGIVDIIVVSLDSAAAVAFQAADLVKSGIATRVAAFTDPEWSRP